MAVSGGGYPSVAALEQSGPSPALNLLIRERRPLLLSLLVGMASTPTRDGHYLSGWGQAGPGALLTVVRQREQGAGPDRLGRRTNDVRFVGMDSSRAFCASRNDGSSRSYSRAVTGGTPGVLRGLVAISALDINKGLLTEVIRLLVDPAMPRWRA